MEKAIKSFFTVAVAGAMIAVLVMFCMSITAGDENSSITPDAAEITAEI